MEVRENLIQLCEKINDHHYKITPDCAEYKVFEKWITDEQIAVMLALTSMKPSLVPMIARKAKMSVKRTREVLHEITDIGLVVQVVRKRHAHAAAPCVEPRERSLCKELSRRVLSHLFSCCKAVGKVRENVPSHHAPSFFLGKVSSFGVIRHVGSGCHAGNAVSGAVFHGPAHVLVRSFPAYSVVYVRRSQLKAHGDLKLQQGVEKAQGIRPSGKAQYHQVPGGYQSVLLYCILNGLYKIGHT